TLSYGQSSGQSVTCRRQFVNQGAQMRQLQLIASRRVCRARSMRSFSETIYNGGCSIVGWRGSIEVVQSFPVGPFTPEVYHDDRTPIERRGSFPGRAVQATPA